MLHDVIKQTTLYDIVRQNQDVIKSWHYKIMHGKSIESTKSIELKVSDYEKFTHMVSYSNC